MANPQTENGYTKVANEILGQVMKANLNGTQHRIILAVWRNTYGFHDTKHELSSSFLAKAIEANVKQVEREVNVLIKRNILIVIGFGKRKARIIKFNKDYDSWLNASPIKKAVTPPEREEKPVKKSAKKKTYGEDNTYFKMALHFHNLVSVVAEEAGVESILKKANLQVWADDFRKLVEIDGIENKKQISEVMTWVTQHYFWKKNVRSAKKFREKYADLAIQMNEESKPNYKKMHPSHSQKDNRDYEIALNKWIANGGDPDDFNYGE